MSRPYMSHHVTNMHEFGDLTDFEIKLQIVTHGTSSRLRKKALPDPKYTLKDMLLDGQREESSSKQNKVIEENLDKSAADLNRVQTSKSKQTSDIKKFFKHQV